MVLIETSRKKNNFLEYIDNLKLCTMHSNDARFKSNDV